MSDPETAALLRAVACGKIKSPEQAYKITSTATDEMLERLMRPGASVSRKEVATLFNLMKLRSEFLIAAQQERIDQARDEFYAGHNRIVRQLCRTVMVVCELLIGGILALLYFSWLKS